MKFLINYNTFTDISSILWALQNLELSRFDNHFILKNDIDEFTFVTSNSEYHPWGTPIFQIENNYDKKIIASHKLIDYDKSKFDYMIYSNLDEPFHDIESENILEFLNDGNIILSATYTNKIIHKNLISDYRFNLYYFYHDKGFNFLNFYNFKEKDSLFGIYEREASNRHSTPQHSMLYNLVKDVVGNELIDFPYIEYPLKNLISHQPRESYVSFGMWKQN